MARAGRRRCKHLDMQIRGGLEALPVMGCLDEVAMLPDMKLTLQNINITSSNPFSVSYVSFCRVNKSTKDDVRASKFLATSCRTKRPGTESNGGSSWLIIIIIVGQP